ncbi:hypothetical protein Aau02nite_19290 [Amorphoplanes auranticolor]|uniref:Uncharacterized protein n=1 Tax=Actinoplanes auranticolor TaxID=47988 RepID=A0A919S729_9ACTN|nr:hypothetical protein Aau02nite_19290 [Actinoplanes auranticolor]
MDLNGFSQIAAPVTTRSTASRPTAVTTVSTAMAAAGTIMGRLREPTLARTAVPPGRPRVAGSAVSFPGSAMARA